METTNETVAEIVKEMRMITYGEECCPDCGADFHRSNSWPKYADRIEAAYRREVTELRKCLKEAVDYNCAMCKSKGTVACEVEGFCTEHKWRRMLEEVNDEGK